ncbi:MAG: SprT-like domain-containing protein [Gemmatimonadota bacterium]
MLRALLARLGLTSRGVQLELGLEPGRDPGRDAAAPGNAPRPDAVALLHRLRSLGLREITTLRLTRNRSTLVSYRGGTLRIHSGFAEAPEEVLRAIAVFVSGRGAARAAARRIIVAHPVRRDPAPPAARRPARHPDDHAMAERLQREHARLNAERFGGALREIRVTVSRRMKTRLGHYAPARSHPEGAEIAISRRHVRRDGWREAIDTLLHEMVHQWQEEAGHAIDHGPTFRRKAHEVGTTPRAKRILR